MYENDVAVFRMKIRIILCFSLFISSLFDDFCILLIDLFIFSKDFKELYYNAILENRVNKLMDISLLV